MSLVAAGQNEAAKAGEAAIQEARSCRIESAPLMTCGDNDGCGINSEMARAAQESLVVCRYKLIAQEVPLSHTRS